MSDDWFAPKANGYGSALPITWQGWALLGGYLSLVTLLHFLIRERHPVVFMTLVLVMTAGLAVITARHTKGGWRWRWGSD